MSLSDAQITEPHRLFIATVEDLLRHRLLQAARPSVWRYFVTSENETLASAELTSRGDELFFSALDEGPFVEGTNVAIGRAEELEAIRQRDYELRVLSIPGIYTVALWLRSDSDDILIPIEPAPSALMPYEVYDEATFVAALRPLALQRSQMEPGMG